MRVYLDTGVYNRPFDDQTQPRIWLESLALSIILQMTVNVDSEASVMQEAAEILLRNLTPSKLARFWAAWQVGQGDYLSWRDEIFGHYDVSKLYEEVLAFQTASANHAQAT